MSVFARRMLVAVAATASLAGCVTVPTGPAVTVLPGSTKSFDQFAADDAACRGFAQNALGPYAGQNASNAAVGTAVAGSAIGAAAGAIIGSVTGQAGAGAAIGAGTGLLFGSAAGSNVAYGSSFSMQRTYDVAYVQCMYARGNQVPGRVAYRSGWAPPVAPAAPPASWGAPPAGSAPVYRPAPANPPPVSAPPPGGYPPPGTPPPQG